MVLLRVHQSSRNCCWCCRVRPIPAGRQQLVHTFVTDYMRNVKDCHLAVTAAASLVITCSSDEILTNATQALEQVTLTICQQNITLLLTLLPAAFPANGQCIDLADVTLGGESCSNISNQEPELLVRNFTCMFST